MDATAWVRARRQHRGRFAGAVLLFVAVALVLAGAAGPAGAEIYDDNALPSHHFTIHGTALGDDKASDVVIGSGVTYVVGQAFYSGAGLDATLTRISHSTWNAATTHKDGAAHGNDAAYAVALGPDGSIYSAGASRNSAGNLDIHVIKWSKGGAVVWAKRYDGPAHGNDSANDIAVDRDGNVVVCGSSEGANGADWTVVSWNKSGTRRWVKRHDGTGHKNDYARQVVLDKDGRAYVTGLMVVAGPLEAAGTAKYSKAGGLLWFRKYVGPLGTGAEANALAAAPAGGVFVAGAAENGATGRDALVVRYSASGAKTVFPLRSGGADAGADELLDVTVTTTNQVVGAGHREAPGGSRNPYYCTFTTAGVSLVAGQTTSTGEDLWAAVAADSLGGFAMAGCWGNAGTDIYTARHSTRENGARWFSLWEAPPTGDNTAVAVATRGTTVATVGTAESVSDGKEQTVLIWVY